MINNNNNSVHLQNFPDISFLKSEDDLVKNMDLARLICSAALQIRDNKNLRVRLPLNKLIIVGKNAKKILPFKDIIADEINVKSIETSENIDEFAENKLQINFKKIGIKFGEKIKEITLAIKNNQWQKISDDEIEICCDSGNIRLAGNDFEIKLTAKSIDDKKFSTMALATNDYLISLDVEVTKDLEEEGIARDIVRAIQQNRRDAHLDVSNRIQVTIDSDSNTILEVAQKFSDYIKTQVLAVNLLQMSEEKIKSTAKNFFINELEGAKLAVGINIV
jgi:isoleucyl-tRNA synthetase